MLVRERRTTSVAAARAERLRAAIADAARARRAGRRCGCRSPSRSAARVAGTGLWTVEALVDAADRALYSAKRRGRDRVRLHADLDAEDARPTSPSRSASRRRWRWPPASARAMPELHCQQVADLVGRDRRGARACPSTASCALPARAAGCTTSARSRSRTRCCPSPARWTTAEWAVMRAPRRRSARPIVRRVAGPADAARAVRHHHERWDGGGYPDGLAGRGDPARGAHRGGRRRVLRDRVRPPVPRRARARGGDRRAARVARARTSTRGSSTRCSRRCTQADEAFEASLDALPLAPY